MRIGIAADHGGLELKVQPTAALKAAAYEAEEFGAHELVTGDDCPDFLGPLAGAVARVRSPGAWPSAVTGESGLKI